jgi:hypothetical protein
MEVHALTLNSSNFVHTGYPGDRLFSVDTTKLSVAIPGCLGFVGYAAGFWQYGKQ